MTAMQEYPEGTFNWTELATSDPDGAMKFYSDLFGWSFDSVPIPDGGSYALAIVKAQEVVGLFQQGEEQAATCLVHPPNFRTIVSIILIPTTVLAGHWLKFHHSKFSPGEGLG